MTRNDQQTIHDQKNLISSDRVEGTALYARDGEKLGTVREIMIDRKSGQVSHAIVGYGGILGMGEDHYPVPWDALEYSEQQEGYVLPFNKDRLDKEKAPRYSSKDQPNFDQNYQEEVWLYYFPR